MSMHSMFTFKTPGSSASGRPLFHVSEALSRLPQRIVTSVAGPEQISTIILPIDMVLNRAGAAIPDSPLAYILADLNTFAQSIQQKYQSVANVQVMYHFYTGPHAIDQQALKQAGRTSTNVDLGSTFVYVQPDVATPGDLTFGHPIASNGKISSVRVFTDDLKAGAFVSQDIKFLPFMFLTPSTHMYTREADGYSKTAVGLATDLTNFMDDIGMSVLTASVVNRTDMQSILPAGSLSGPVDGDGYLANFYAWIWSPDGGSFSGYDYNGKLDTLIRLQTEALEQLKIIASKPGGFGMTIHEEDPYSTEPETETEDEKRAKAEAERIRKEAEERKRRLAETKPGDLPSAKARFEHELAYLKEHVPKLQAFAPLKPAFDALTGKLKTVSFMTWHGLSARIAPDEFMKTWAGKFKSKPFHVSSALISINMAQGVKGLFEAPPTGEEKIAKISFHREFDNTSVSENARKMYNLCGNFVDAVKTLIEKYKQDYMSLTILAQFECISQRIDVLVGGAEELPTETAMEVSQDVGNVYMAYYILTMLAVGTLKVATSQYDTTSTVVYYVMDGADGEAVKAFGGALAGAVAE